MKDGVPWVIPPDWIDPGQQPARNRYFEQVQQMRDLGTQLRLGLNLDDSRGQPTSINGPDSDPPSVVSDPPNPPDAPDRASE